MSLSMHAASTPVFLKMLANLGHWLDAAEAHAAAKKFDPSVLLGARLAPDMLPFTRQIQIACDAAKFCVARLSGTEAPKFEDNEASIADLKRRIANTAGYIASVPAAQIDGSEGKAIEVPMRRCRIIWSTGPCGDRSPRARSVRVSRISVSTSSP